MDPTENIRRALVAEINRDPGSREALEEQHGKVWDTGEMTDDFSRASTSTSAPTEVPNDHDHRPYPRTLDHR
jgi:hypothetical protein